MTKAELMMWKTNLINAALSAARAKGDEAVKYVLARYDASSLESLAECYFPDVFAALEDMAKAD